MFVQSKRLFRIRRALAVVIGLAAAVAFLSGSGGRRCIVLLVGDSTDQSCLVALKPSPSFLLLAGFLMLGAVVMWFAPWTGHTPRARLRRLTMRAERRARTGFGIGLIGIGVAVTFSSIAGWFVTNGYSACGWFELWCDQVERDGTFSTARLVSVAFGVTTAWWGMTELLAIGRDARAQLARVLGAAGLFGLMAMVLADQFGLGWQGFGRSQLVGVLISGVTLGLAVVLARPYHEDGFIPDGRLLFTVSSIAASLGVWTITLLRLGRTCTVQSGCSHRAWGALLVGLPLAAAAIYLSAQRLERQRRTEPELLEEAKFQIWSRTGRENVSRTPD